MPSDNGKTLTENIKRIDQQLTVHRNRWSPLVPEGFTADEFQALIISCLDQTPELTKCTQTSLWGALLNAVKLGLKPDGLLGEAWLLPYGREVKLIIGYKGLITLAYRSGEVQSFDAQIVREGDAFDVELGLKQSIKHKPSREPNRHEAPITHVYAYCMRTNGATNINVMTWAEIERHRNQYSRGANSASSPWKTAPEQMAKKTAIRSLINSGVIPLSADVREALEADGETVKPVKYEALAEVYQENQNTEVVEATMAD